MKKIKLFVVIFTSLFILSCESCERQVCGLAKRAATSLSTTLAVRWECNSEKIYSSVMSPFEKTICKEEPVSQTIWTKTICPLVLSQVVSLGAEEIATRYECNLIKVKEDLSAVMAICAVLPL